MLQKQPLEIHFDKGLNTKVDSKLLPPGSLVTLDDCCFDDSNSIKKRPGYTTRPTTVDSGGSLPTAFMGFNHQNLMGQIGTDGHAHVYSISNANWHPVEHVPMTRIQHEQVMRNTSNQNALDVCGLGTIELYAWEDSRGGVRASIRDGASGLPLLEDVLLDASGARPRCLVLGSTLMVVYLSGANVKVSKVSVSAISSGFATSTLKTDAKATTQLLDGTVDQTNTRVVVAYKSNSSDDIKVFHYNGTTASASTTIASGAHEALHINYFSASLAVAYGKASTTSLNASLGTLALSFSATFPVDSAVASVNRIASAQNSGDLRLAYDTGTGFETETKTAQITTSSTVSSAAQSFMIGVGVASGVFTLNGALALAVVHEDDLQPTLFVAFLTGAMAGTVAARTLGSLSGGLDSSGRVPAVLGSGTDALVFPALCRGRLVISETHDVTPIGIVRIAFGGLTAHDRDRVELGGLTFLPGGSPQLFDGVGFVEAGFNLYPHDMEATAFGSGLFLSAGSYQYAACLEWVDAQGNLHRSAPSVPFSVVVTAGQGVSIDLVSIGQTRRAPVWPVTNSLPGRAQAKLVLYRTAANGTTFYRLNQPAGWGWPGNDTVGGGTFLDNATSDEELQANEVLYTQGGALENEPPPACRYAWVHQERWFVAGIDSDPYGFAYSHQYVKGECPSFSEVLRGRVPPSLGVITGGASMDDRCVIFCERGQWVIAGSGPDITGGQNGYSEPQAVNESVGCSANRSIVRTDMGLMFLSVRGLRLLDRSLSTQLIGVPVDSLATTVVAAQVDDTRPQVRFYTGTHVLVYDFLWQQWSRYRNHSCVDAVRYNSAPVHIRSTGTTCAPGGTTDDGTAIAAVLETGWISFAGVQAIQRVWRALVLGTFTAAHTMTLEVGYDFESDYEESKTVDVDAQGSASTPLQFRHHLKRQKCESLRLRLTASGSGGSVGFSSMAFEVGTKKGSAKLSAGRTV